MRKSIALVLLAIMFSGAANAATISLVCETRPSQRILAFGSIFHVTIDTGQGIAWDDAGGDRSAINESGDYFSWEHVFPRNVGGSATMELDRRTLVLSVDTGMSQAYYACQMTPGRQF